MNLHEAIAQGLAEHRIQTLFGLMGDGNLFFADSFSRQVGCRYVAAAHEASAVMMAHGYARASGTIGAVTVTHGPALTNAITALVDGALGRVPMLVIAGDTAAEDVGNVQNIAQHEFVVPTGAGFEQMRTAETGLHDLATAIRRSYLESRPIVLNVPANLWWHTIDYQFVKSGSLGAQAPQPDPAAMDEAIGIIASAHRPLILAGAGARDAGATIAKFGDRIGAPLATTLKAKDLFRRHPHNVGVFGTLGDPQCLDAIGACDCIIAFGAGLNDRTTDHQDLLQGKAVIQVDRDPTRLGKLSRVTAGVLGDAASVADMMAGWLDSADIGGSNFAASQLAKGDTRATQAPARQVPSTGTVDVRAAMQNIDQIVPADRTLVFDTGRFIVPAIRHLHAPDPYSFIDTLNFAAIGLGTSAAVGAGIARPERPVLLACGDGGLMLGGLADFHAAVRHEVDLIMVVFNDGAYGAEHIQFTARGMDASHTTHPWPDFAQVAVAMGGYGVTVSSDDEFDNLRQAIALRTGPLLIDIMIDPPNHR